MFEVGAILEGIPVVRIHYSEELEEKSSILRTGLFAAIQTFAKEAFRDETEELRLQNYTICLQTMPLFKDINLTLYAIADKGKKYNKAVRSALKNVIKRLEKLTQKPMNLKNSANAILRSIFEEEFMIYL